MAPDVDDLVLVVRVHGIPAPQGSKRHVGGGRMIESSKKVGPWREAVKAAVLTATGRRPTTLDGPVQVDITFILPRPKSHLGTGRNAGRVRDSAPAEPTTKPDLDKLLRSTMDALTDVGVLRDDAQVVRIEAAKVYAWPEEPPGATIHIWRQVTP